MIKEITASVELLRSLEGGGSGSYPVRSTGLSTFKAYSESSHLFFTAPKKKM
ncbi:MAG: hypothetical protein LBK18_08800 [Prevotellaceae bacterium]|nr:hypothetical protein [Prevotellaceae bacterium]